MGARAIQTGDRVVHKNLGAGTVVPQAASPRHGYVRVRFDDRDGKGPFTMGVPRAVLAVEDDG